MLTSLIAALVVAFGPYVHQVESDFTIVVKEASILAKVLHHESRGEIGYNTENTKYKRGGYAIDGQLAIAEVILNRTFDKRWHSTITKVILQPRQFTDFDPKNYGLNQIPQLTRQIGVEYAINAYQFYKTKRRINTNLTRRANHYHSLRVDPSWNDSMTHTVTIGNHKFWRGD